MTRAWQDQRSGGIPVTSHCPVRAATLAWLTTDGRRALTVVCKATYELCPGTSPLAEDQDGILPYDVHWEGDPRNSLRAQSDLVPFKPRADIVVTGHVHPPPGQRVCTLIARVTVGTVDKAIAVHGDRCFRPDGQLTPSAELTRIPMAWERAAGGPGTVNPVGVAPPSLTATGSTMWAPTFQAPGTVLTSPRDPIAPVGFGPLSPHWPIRAHKLGRAAASWDPLRWYLQSIPAGFDPAHFNSAPPDQQTDYLLPEERITLEHLHPEHERLTTRLEGVVPRVVVRGPGRADHAVELRCDTLWIDTDRGVCCVTWRGTIALEIAENATIVVTADGQVNEPSAPECTVWAGEVAGAVAVATKEAGVADATLALGVRTPAKPAPLPFAPSAPGTPSIALYAARPPEPRLPSTDSTATLAGPLIVATRDLPPGWAGTDAPMLPPAPGIAASSAAAPSPPPSPAPARFTTDILPEPGFPAETASFTAPSPPLPTDLHAGATTLEPEPFGLPPPSMMTPLFQAEDVSRDIEARTEKPPPLISAALPTATSSLETKQRAAAEPAALPIDPEGFGIERWAEISAEIDHAERDEQAPQKRARVLDDNKVPEVDWLAVDRHWKEALEREATMGGFALRLRFDAAYVATVERLRGWPISASEYASFLAAGERPRVVALLREQGMPAGAHLPIMRQWTAKIARDPKLSIEMLQAVAALRGDAAGSHPMTPSADRGA